MLSIVAALAILGLFVIGTVVGVAMAMGTFGGDGGSTSPGGAPSPARPEVPRGAA